MRKVPTGGRKRLTFRGDSLAALKLFPEAVRRKAGQELDWVQWGRDPVDWKPMNGIGAGVREIRLRDESGIYRVIYVTKIGDRIFVLHCFQKKTQRTAVTDINLAVNRYKELVREYSR